MFILSKNTTTKTLVATRAQLGRGAQDTTKTSWDRLKRQSWLKTEKQGSDGKAGRTTAENEPLRSHRPKTPKGSREDPQKTVPPELQGLSHVARDSPRTALSLFE